MLCKFMKTTLASGFLEFIMKLAEFSLFEKWKGFERFSTLCGGKPDLGFGNFGVGLGGGQDIQWSKKEILSHF